MTILRLLLAAALAWTAVGSARACVFCSAMGSAPCDAPPAVAHEGSHEGSAHEGDPETPPIAYFTLQGGQWPQPGGDGTPVTITYSYNNFLNGGLRNLAGQSVSASYLRVVTQEAFGLWASVAPLHFVEVPDVGTPVFQSNTAQYLAYPPGSFGQVRLNHRFINGTDAQNGMPTTKALAYFPSNGGNIAGDIHFDNGDPWEVVGTSSEPDVLGVLTHEIGHTLGIGHSTLDGAVMFPRALRRMGPGTGILTPDDVAAVRAVYGAGVGSVTPLFQVPEPATALLVLLALASRPARRR